VEKSFIINSLEKSFNINFISNVSKNLLII